MTDFLDDDERVAFFFTDPRTAPAAHSRRGVHSILYLLRRELIETLGYTRKTDGEDDVSAGGSRHRLFASLILMFTAMDLLGKFMFPDDNRATTRFLKFVRAEDGAGRTEFEVQLLWAWRNSLVHAFGTPAPGDLAAFNVTTYVLAQRKEPPGAPRVSIVDFDPASGVAALYVDGVFSVLRRAIRAYYESLVGTGSQEQRTKFREAFEKYGLIQMA